MGNACDHHVCSSIEQCACCGFIPYPQDLIYSKNADWMSILAHQRPDILLRQIKLPGAHDSATSTIPGSIPFSSISRTQNLSIFEQLEYGVRFFDVRIGCASLDPKELSIMHGPHYGDLFVNILKDMAAFVSLHPEEVIIVKIKEEQTRGIPNEIRHFVLKTINSIFGNKLIGQMETQQGPRGWFIIETVLLKELQMNRKNFIVAYHKNEFQNNRYPISDESWLRLVNSYNVFEAYQIFRNKWHKTNSPTTLFRRNLDFVERFENESSLLRISQFTITPKVDSLCSILQIMMGYYSLRVDQHVKTLYKQNSIQKKVKAIQDRNINVIWFDFIDYDPTMTSSIIGANFTTFNLQILKILAKEENGFKKPIDFTHRLNNQLPHHSLYLIDPYEDLDLDTSKDWSVTVVYRFGGDPVQEDIFKIKREENKRVLINMPYYLEKIRLEKQNLSLKSKESQSTGY